MNSIFKQKMDERALDAVYSNPSVQSGWVVRTTDVWEAEIKNNAFFTSINNISYAEGKRFLQLDSVKYGTSIVTKAPGVSKGEKVYVNPKAHDLQSYGSAYGKVGQTDASGNDIALADLIFSGANNQTPTVMGVMLRKNLINTNIQSSPKDKIDNMPADTNAPPKLSGGIGSTADFNKELQSSGVYLPGFTGIMPAPINPDSGKKIKGADKTTKGAGGANLRTGTALFDKGTIRQIAKAIPTNNPAIGVVLGSIKF